ncbi:WecB/TagA/CpsF family glycosyltransferase [Caulobacter sp. 17J65-9]|uniref:WecB/TagA/CpsF family glycosyltransferase n=1 Tax=Caulobacter sp. 17J65-9 TaxID=2709382 RepID=UPI0013C7C387|nr:WecB/TagA/CpsF family glycosyltransferase [Caulobacter sp. 17J65-9]NEX95315.1 WecB/TagA/CpsF family glycosyltransferase [Caulobacter sp. 17J65-9]
MKRLSAPTRVALLGGAVDLVTPDEVLDFAAARIAAAEPAVIANHNLHSLALLKREPRMRALYDVADLIEIDSVPLVWWGQLLGRPLSRAHRCTYLDWKDAFWARASAGGWRVFYLGAAPGVAELAAEKLRAAWPGVVIGTRDGYFDMTPGSAGNEAVLAQIEAFGADVVFVGMGMPRQELWIAQNRARLTRGVLFPVGGAFDYEAGVQAAAPRWLGRLGLEWLYRFARDPGRLFERYFVEPWTLAGAAAEDVAAAVLGVPATRRRPVVVRPAAAVAERAGPVGPRAAL